MSILISRHSYIEFDKNKTTQIITSFIGNVIIFIEYKHIN